jgi:hypothetical protein
MNKNRLRTLSAKAEVSKRHRIQYDVQVHQTNLDASIEHLYLAYEHLKTHLRGKNKLGMLTNILNATYEIKKNLK